MSKELLFSLTAKDFEFKFSRGSGHGGQGMQTCNNRAQCFHRPSGAYGEAFEGRSQRKNKEIAFTKMAKTKKFQDWCKLEAMRVTGKLKLIEEDVDMMMAKESDFNIEVFKNGKWCKWDL